MSNDAQIKKFRVAVEAKRKALGTKPKTTYITNALLDLNGDKVNLNTLTTIDKCVELVTILVARQNFMTRANELLGTDVNPSVGDYTIDQWIADIKLRVSVLLWEAEKKSLTAMDKKLAALRSEDARTSDAIADIATQLGE